MLLYLVYRREAAMDEIMVLRLKGAACERKRKEKYIPFKISALLASFPLNLITVSTNS